MRRTDEVFFIRQSLPHGESYRQTYIFAVDDLGLSNSWRVMERLSSPRGTDAVRAIYRRIHVIFPTQRQRNARKVVNGTIEGARTWTGRFN